MFSKILVNLMEKRNISQSELASVLKTHRQNVYQWVSGKTIPRNEMLLKLASYFEVSLDYLLGKKKDLDNLQDNSCFIHKFLDDGQKRLKTKDDYKSSKTLKEIFSENLKYYRKQLGLTQDDFAKNIGTDPVYISYIENGKRFPSVEYIEKMAQTLGIESYRLFIPINVEFNKLANEALYARIKANIIKAIDFSFEI